MTIGREQLLHAPGRDPKYLMEESRVPGMVRVAYHTPDRVIPRRNQKNAMLVPTPVWVMVCLTPRVIVLQNLHPMCFLSSSSAVRGNEYCWPRQVLLFISLVSESREYLTPSGSISPCRLLSPGFPYLYMAVPGVSYTMHTQRQPVVPLARGTFSLYIAPSPVLIPALSRSLALLQGSILLLSGPSPAIIPRLSTGRSEKKHIILTHTPRILTALEDATGQIIIIEHDRALYDDHACLIRPVALLCRRIAAERRTVLICATRPDGWLNTFESYAHRMVLVRHLPPDRPNPDLLVPGSGWQMTLQGVV